MTHKSVYHKLIFLPLMISVFLLCTGSLINFHQYRIWHKPLLPELVADKRDSEKILKHLTPHLNSFPAQAHFIILDAICAPTYEFRSPSESAFRTYILSYPVPATFYAGNGCLRGPPVI